MSRGTHSMVCMLCDARVTCDWDDDIDAAATAAEWVLLPKTERRKTPHSVCAPCMSEIAATVHPQRSEVARFVDAWSKWALNSYVCTDAATRANLRTLRAQYALDEVDGVESWEVDKLHQEMIDARDALDGAL